MIWFVKIFLGKVWGNIFPSEKLVLKEMETKLSGCLDSKARRRENLKENLETLRGQPAIRLGSSLLCVFINNCIVYAFVSNQSPISPKWPYYPFCYETFAVTMWAHTWECGRFLSNHFDNFQCINKNNSTIQTYNLLCWEFCRYSCYWA